MGAGFAFSDFSLVPVKKQKQQTQTRYWVLLILFKVFRHFSPASSLRKPV